MAEEALNMGAAFTFKIRLAFFPEVAGAKFTFAIQVIRYIPSSGMVTLPAESATHPPPNDSTGRLLPKVTGELGLTVTLLKFA